MSVCAEGRARGFQGLGKGQRQPQLPARVLIASWRPSGIHLTSSFQEWLYFLDSPVLLNGQEEGNCHKP